MMTKTKTRELLDELLRRVPYRRAVGVVVINEEGNCEVSMLGESPISKLSVSVEFREGHKTEEIVP